MLRLRSVRCHRVCDVGCGLRAGRHGLLYILYSLFSTADCLLGFPLIINRLASHHKASMITLSPLSSKDPPLFANRDGSGHRGSAAR